MSKKYGVFFSSTSTGVVNKQIRHKKEKKNTHPFDNCFNAKCYLLVVMISLRSLKTNTTGRKELKFHFDTI